MVIASRLEVADLGSEDLCVIANTSLTSDSARARLRLEIIKTGMAMDVTVEAVYFVPLRIFLTHASGKPSWQANSTRAESLDTDTLILIGGCSSSRLSRKG